MPSTRPAHALTLLLLFTTPAVATEPMDVARDEQLVVGRTVMPRIAYRALEPTANPVRVEATLFPGRVFHGVMDGIVGRLAADDELGERVSPNGAGAATFGRGGLVPLAHGPSASPTGGPGARSAGGAVGGAVLRVTAGLGDRMGQSLQRTVVAPGAGR
ncbi:hypothetical protein [Lysobacter humi (ex Lee et al. 2017)]